jgi:hypothetical protein
VIVYEGYDREEALALFHIAEENSKNEQITYRINKVSGRIQTGSTPILPMSYQPSRSGLYRQ